MARPPPSSSAMTRQQRAGHAHRFHVLLGGCVTGDLAPAGDDEDQGQAGPAQGRKERVHVWILDGREPVRSEEHTSELQSLMRTSYAVFCLKKKNNIINYDYAYIRRNNKMNITEY